MKSIFIQTISVEHYSIVTGFR